MALLVVVSGLPGTGKSALADAISDTLAAPVFNKDHIEASLWRSGVTADDNSWQVAEDMLGTLADDHGAQFKPIECVCSDEAVHRDRLVLDAVVPVAENVAAALAYLEA